MIEEDLFANCEGIDDDVIVLDDSPEQAAGNLSIDLFDDEENFVEEELPAGPSSSHVLPPPTTALTLRDVLEREQQATSSSHFDASVQPTTSSTTNLDVSAEEQIFHEKRENSLAHIEKPDCGMGEGFTYYMRLKKDKLQYQVNVLSRPTNVSSNLFEGISIFVNGHTDPTALELRELIQAHGGEYHCYMEYKKTTYTIASSLASVKVDKLRKDEKFLRPAWIVDSIAAGEQLPIDDYLLLPNKPSTCKTITTFLHKGTEEKKGEKILDAKDPGFIEQFYSRSRLHLISTLAQEMKDYVNGLRETAEDNTAKLNSLQYISGTSGPSEPVVFHIDLDCFFVSVAIRNKPGLADKPIAITHSKGAGGGGFAEIASCSYAARQMGVKNGMLVRDALRLCPTIVCLPYLFEEYKEVSKAIYTIVSRYTLEVKAVSCDEMFVNFTRLCNELCISDVTQLAEHIRREIKAETKCTASVGIGPTVLIARLATRHAKPDGVRWIRKNQVVEFIAQEKVENLPSVGRSIMQKLESSFGEMRCCRDLQAISQARLETLLGKNTGHQVYKLCRGEDDSLKDFLASTVRKSVSCDINYGIRFTLKEEVVKFLGVIAGELARKLSMCRMLAGSLTLKLMIRSPDAPIETAKYLGHGKCDCVNRALNLPKHTADPEVLAKHIVRVYDQLSPVVSDLRGIGVQLARLQSENVAPKKDAAIQNFFRVAKSSQERKNEKRDPEVTTIEDVCEDVPKKRPPIIQIDKVDYELPTAITRTPAFCGESKLEKIREKIQVCMLDEPSKWVVDSLVNYFIALIVVGNLSTLMSVARTCLRLVGRKSDTSEWPFTIRFILEKVDKLIVEKYGSPMFFGNLV